MNTLMLEYNTTDDNWPWDFLVEDFESLFRSIFPKGDVSLLAMNHGWNHKNGYIPERHYDDPSNVLSKVMVSGASVRVYKRCNSEYGKHLAINTCHHDVPMWDQEWTYVVRPKYFEKGLKKVLDK